MSETYILGNVGENKAQLGTNTMLNTTGSGNSAFGFGIFTNLTTGVNNSGFGSDIASGGSANSSNCTAFGTRAIQDITIATDVSGFGYESLISLTTGSDNLAFGRNSGTTVTTTSGNAIFGANADVSNAGVTNAVIFGENAIGADRSVVMGAGAQCLDTSANSDCIVVGGNALAGNGSLQTVVVGSDSGNIGPLTTSLIVGQETTNATASTFANTIMIGWLAGRRVYDSTDNIGIGEETGSGMNGARNTAVGHVAMSAPNIIGNKYDNTAFGYFAGSGLAGNENTIVGTNCGPSLDPDFGTTAIGSSALENVSGDSAATIATSTTSGIAGVGGFTIGTTSLLMRISNIVFGNVTDIGGGTAATGGVGELFAVIKMKDGSGTESELSYVDFTGATTAGVDGKYFLISTTTIDYYVWFDIDNLSVDPMVGGRTGIEVNLSSGAPATLIALFTRLAMNAVNSGNSFLVATNSVKSLRVANTVFGNATDIGAGTAVGSGKLTGVVKIFDGTVGTGETAIIDCEGTLASVISGSYFLISTTTVDYYVWYNDGTATDPMVLGRTGIEIAVAISDSNTVVGWRALIGSGGTPPNRSFTENVAVGVSACVGLRVGGDFNIFVGAVVAPVNNLTGASNLIVGQDANCSPTTTNSVTVGTSATGSGIGATTLGYGSSASPNGTIAFGMNSSTTSSIVCQIGEPTVSASGTATFKYRTQTICDEAWIGGGNTSVVIDNNGNICRGTNSLLTGATTDTTPLTLETYTMVDNTSRQIEALVMGRRIGGSVGSPSDIYSVRIDAIATRTGGSVVISKVTEVQKQDPVNSMIITNTVAGAATNISAGTAVGGVGELLSIATLVDGAGATAEVSSVDTTGATTVGLDGKYFGISSTTVNYYVWFDIDNLSADPAPGGTPIEVDLVTGDNEADIATKTATAIDAVGGIGVTFTAAVQSPWDIDVVASGTDVILEVTGATATDISWKAYTRNLVV